MSGQTIRVGIIGLGEIAQVSHISVLNNLSQYFQITYLCDASQQALRHCAARVNGKVPALTSNPEELCAAAEVDTVVVSSATAYHPAHVILALKHDKYVLVEKPIALCERDINDIIEAEKKSRGRVFVGYQRRYAQAFVDAIAEIGGAGKIQFVRVRDIIGANSSFVNQSASFPVKFTDFAKTDSDDMVEKDVEMINQALVTEWGVELTEENGRWLRCLGGLGTHDLAAMREIIGMPQKVIGAALSNFPFWSVLFQYDGFPVVYESGMNNVPQFDAHIELYSNEKIVRVNYDSPYVKGLPVTMTVRENIGNDGFQERVVRKTYEDPYTVEFKEFWKVISQKLQPKTSAEDARQDVELFKLIIKAGQA